MNFILPTSFSFAVNLEGGVASTTRIMIPSIDINNPVNDCGDTVKKNSNLFVIFLLGLLGGLIALLTPCVFPMIPVTVIFLYKKNRTEEERNTRGNALWFFYFPDLCSDNSSFSYCQVRHKP